LTQIKNSFDHKAKIKNQNKNARMQCPNTEKILLTDHEIYPK